MTPHFIHKGTAAQRGGGDLLRSRPGCSFSHALNQAVWPPFLLGDLRQTVLSLLSVKRG